MGVTVIRGDCFEITKTWRSASVPLIVTDPPYGKILRERWDVEQYGRLGALLSRLLVDGGTAYVWGGIGTHQNRPFFKWLAAVEDDTDLVLHNLITWSKKRAYGVKDNYLFTREECAMLVKGGRPKTFNIPLLAAKRGYAGYNEKYPAKSEFLRRTNVWHDVTELFSGKIHPAEKPARLAEIMIEVSSNVNDHVVDLFAGSGSTGVAALRSGRKCTLIERSDCAMHSLTAANAASGGRS